MFSPRSSNAWSSIVPDESFFIQGESDLYINVYTESNRNISDVLRKLNETGGFPFEYRKRGKNLSQSFAVVALVAGHADEYPIAALTTVYEKGSTKVVTDESVVELYDFARNHNAPPRYKGKGNILLAFIKEYMIHTYGDAVTIWLGVAPLHDNPPSETLAEGTNFPMRLVEYYRENGFYFPGILPHCVVPDIVTPLGTETGFCFLSGYYGNIFVEALQHPFLTGQSVRYDASWLIENNIMDYENEVGGFFAHTDGDFYNSLPICRLNHPIIDGNEGTCSVTLTSPSPDDKRKNKWKRITAFHTHPIACYNSYSSLYGSPSTIDIKSMIKTYFYGHFDSNLVFARECVYSYQVHPFVVFAFNRGFLTWDDVKNGISELLAYLETTIEYEQRFRKFEVADLPNLFEQLTQNGRTRFSESELQLIDERTDKAMRSLCFILSTYAYSFKGLFRIPFLMVQYDKNHKMPTIFESSMSNATRDL
jgi:hypothetical protein